MCEQSDSPRKGQTGKSLKLDLTQGPESPNCRVKPCSRLDMSD